MGLFDFISNTIKDILELWDGMFTAPLDELNIIQVGMAAGMVFLGWKALQAIFKSSKTGSQIVVRIGKVVAKTLSAKNRASKIVCPHCGRTLDKCVCPKNKGVSYSKRIKKYRLEQKAKRLQIG
jgi:predicted RNA-binding Zn-ribbon protein involved in translation (DUF1610 family)